MNVTRTYDIELIRSVVTSDTFWDDVTEDGQEKEYYEPNLQKYIWLRVDGNELVALIAVEAIEGYTVRVHPMVLAEHRDVSRETMVELVRWLDTTDYEKITADIPKIYRHVRLFALDAGLKQEGVRTSCHLKNGEMHDMYSYSATRKEINERFKDGWSKFRQKCAKSAN